MIRKLLAHPLTYGKDIDSPETTDLRREIINSKPFLKRVYLEWYHLVLDHFSPVNATDHILEIGSGAGFFSAVLPSIISTDLLPIKGIDAVLDGQKLPFAPLTLQGIVMVNVLHHIPNATSFFDEARRTVKPGGRVVMIEPWITPWSRWVYTHLHHEPLDETADQWELDSNGPLSGANSALPWILFSRDRAEFQESFPEFQVEHIHPFMPLRYLLSGGISMRNLMPASTFTFWRSVETVLSGLADQLSMFAVISIKKEN